MSLSAEVRVRAGQFELEVRLRVDDGEVVALLGPNGAGKSTFLRAVAGLTAIVDGRVELGGRVLESPAEGVRLPPEDRRIGVVFQDYLLFPHLDVRENVAFGLRARGTPAAAARSSADGWLARFDIARCARLRPRQLSGGQAQRVALARALAIEPDLLALDEPLSALDVSARHNIRRDLHGHLREHRGPTLLITHDPLEAITLADRLVVLENGCVTQSGGIDEVTRQPRSEWVARWVGVNLYKAIARGHTVKVGEVELTSGSSAEGSVFVMIRPQAVALHRVLPGGSPRNVWPCVVAGIELFSERVRVSLHGALPTVAEVTPAAVADLGLTTGTPVWAAVKATEIDTYPA